MDMPVAAFGTDMTLKGEGLKLPKRANNGVNGIPGQGGVGQGVVGLGGGLGVTGGSLNSNTSNNTNTNTSNTSNTNNTNINGSNNRLAPSLGEKGDKGRKYPPSAPSSGSASSPSDSDSDTDNGHKDADKTSDKRTDNRQKKKEARSLSDATRSPTRPTGGHPASLSPRSRLSDEKENQKEVPVVVSGGPLALNDSDDDTLSPKKASVSLSSSPAKRLSLGLASQSFKKAGRNNLVSNNSNNSGSSHSNHNIMSTSSSSDAYTEDQGGVPLSVSLSPRVQSPRGGKYVRSLVSLLFLHHWFIVTSYSHEERCLSFLVFFSPSLSSSLLSSSLSSLSSLPSS